MLESRNIISNITALWLESLQSVALRLTARLTASRRGDFGLEIFDTQIAGVLDITLLNGSQY